MLSWRLRCSCSQETQTLRHSCGLCPQYADSSHHVASCTHADSCACTLMWGLHLFFLNCLNSGDCRHPVQEQTMEMISSTLSSLDSYELLVLNRVPGVQAATVPPAQPQGLHGPALPSKTSRTGLTAPCSPWCPRYAPLVSVPGPGPLPLPLPLPVRY